MIFRMNGCHHCVLLIVVDERRGIRIYSATGRPFPKIAAANNPTFLYSVRLLLQYFRGVALVLSIVLVLVLVLVVVAVPHCAVQ